MYVCRAYKQTVTYRYYIIYSLAVQFCRLCYVILIHILILVWLLYCRHGFYVIGNMDSMTASSPTWKKITETLGKNDNIGTHLQLKCKNHGEITKVAKGEDFCGAPEGGCSRMCDTVLDKCNHKCRLVSASTHIFLHELSTVKQFFIPGFRC
jgi:hypothetical protein